MGLERDLRMAGRSAANARDANTEAASAENRKSPRELYAEKDQGCGFRDQGAFIDGEVVEGHL
jgi:hypothetical protein